MIKEEEVIEILKKFQQQDYKYGGMSIPTSNYNAIARAIVEKSSTSNITEKDKHLKYTNNSGNKRQLIDKVIAEIASEKKIKEWGVKTYDVCLKLANIVIKTHSMSNVSNSSIGRKQAEFLWKLLDDIDTASDMLKPSNLDSWERYYSWVNKKLRKRFDVFKSDGYKLMTPDNITNTTKQNKHLNFCKCDEPSPDIIYGEICTECCLQIDPKTY